MGGVGRPVFRRVGRAGPQLSGVAVDEPVKLAMAGF